LRLIATELELATVRASVNLSMLTDFENFSSFAPAERQVTVVHAMLDQLVAWSRTLEPLRAGSAADDEDARPDPLNHSGDSVSRFDGYSLLA
jgi:alpha/beta superfamily hydrolase